MENPNIDVVVDDTIEEGTMEIKDSEELELSLAEALRVIEETVKYLNKKNNEVQEHIRSNKDQENQKIVDKLLEKYNEYFKYLGGANTETYKDLTKRKAHFKRCVDQIIRESTGKDIKDL